MLIEQDIVDIEVCRRSEGWVSNHYFMGDEVTFESIELSLPVEEIYARVENDDKGFGFIQVDSGKDVFIHISALAHMSRRPVVGDVVFFQIETDGTGKSRAINAKIEGVPRVEKPLESWFLVPVNNQANSRQTNKQFYKPYTQTHPRMSYGRERSGFLSKITSLVILFGALSAYDAFNKKQDNSNNLSQTRWHTL